LKKFIDTHQADRSDTINRLEQLEELIKDAERKSSEEIALISQKKSDDENIALQTSLSNRLKLTSDLNESYRSEQQNLAQKDTEYNLRFGELYAELSRAAQAKTVEKAQKYIAELQGKYNQNPSAVIS
jgi:hypothetical protein